MGSTVNVTPGSGGTWSSSDPLVATVTNGGAVTGIIPGAVMLTYTRTSDGCDNSKPFLVWAQPSTASAGPDQAWCEVNQFTMDATEPTTGSGHWTRFSGPLSFSITDPASPVTTITGVTTGSYVFRWTTSNGSVCDTSTDLVTVTNRDQIVLTGPIGSTICVGGQETLSVSATGGSGVYDYQWQYWDGSQWQNVGTNSNTYTTPVLNSPGDYQYQVIISDQDPAGNGGCTTTSSIATVTVMPDATLIPPSNQGICLGGTAYFTVSVSGGTGTFTYQWQYYNGSTYSNVVNGVPMGAVYTNPATPSMTVSGSILPGTYTYRVVITPSVPSCAPPAPDDVTLTVYQDPSITVQPVGPFMGPCEGQTYTLNLTASGGVLPLIYQWQYLDGSNWLPAPGINDQPSYTTPPLTQDTYYRCMVSSAGSGCNTVYSNEVLVPVNNINPGSIGVDQTICEGEIPDEIVTVTAASADGTISYLWEYSLDGMTGWTPIDPMLGGTMEEYQPGALTQDTWYRRKTYSWYMSMMCYEYSNIIRIWVNNMDPGSIGPDLNLCHGQVPDSIYSVVPATGDGTITYQWWESADNVAFTLIPGSNSRSHMPDADNYITYYKRLGISTLNGVPCSEFSNSVIVVIRPINAGAVGNDQILCAGEIPDPFVEITPATYEGIPGYQWQISTTSPATGFTAIPGANDITYQETGSLTVDTWYRRMITASWWGDDPVVCTAYTAPIAITIIESPVISVQVQGATLCEGDMHSMSVTVTGAIGTINYQWQESTTGCTGPWSDIPGATNSSYTTVQLYTTHYYQVIITFLDIECADLISECATVNIIPNPSPADAGPEQVWCNVNQFTMNATPPVTGTGYWTRVSGPLSFSITDPASPVTTVTGVTTGSYVFRWTTSNGSVCDTSTDLVNITNRDQIVLTGPIGSTICAGGQETLSVSATGGSGVYNYQWQYWDGSQWQNVGNNSNTYTTPVLNSPGDYQYQVIVSDQDPAGNGGCSTISDTATVTVVPDAVGTLLTNDTANICYGGDAVFTVSVTGGTGTYTYQWQYYNETYGTWGDVTDDAPYGVTYSGQTTATLTGSGYPSAGYFRYRAIITLSDPACGPIAPLEVVVNVQPDPYINSQPTSPSYPFCEGDNYTFTVGAVFGTPGPGYLWQWKVGGIWVPAPPVNNQASYTTPPLVQDTWFRVLVFGAGSGCDTVISNELLLVVNNMTPGSICCDQISCEGAVPDTIRSLVNATGDGEIGYFWEYSTDYVNWTVINPWNPFTVPWYVPGPLYEDTWFRRQAESAINGAYKCYKTSDTILIIVNNLDPGIIGNAQVVCQGDNPDPLTSVVDATGDGTITYQWQISYNNIDYNDIPGAISEDYTPASLPGIIQYRRKAISTLNGVPCADYSNAVEVTTSPITPGSIGYDQEICSGDFPDPFVNIQSGTGDGVVTYQWQKSIVSATTGFSDITGANDPGYTEMSPLTVTTWYRRMCITYWSGVPGTCSAVSNVLEVTVDDCCEIDFTSINVTPTNPSACNLADGSILIENAGLFNSTGYIVYYTRNGGSPTGPLTITTTTSGSLLITGLDDGSYSNIVIRSSTDPTCEGTYIGPVVLNDPTIDAGPDRTACQFGTATMAAIGIGSWSESAGNPGTSVITDPSSATTSITGFSQPGTYSYIWTSQGCTDIALIEVDPVPAPPGIGTITQPSCTVATGSVILNGLPTPGIWTITRTPDGVTTYTGSGSSTIITGLPAGTTYTFTVTDANECASSPSAGVVINSQPPTPPAPTVTVDCSGGPGNATVTITAPVGAGYEYSLNGGPWQISPVFTGIADGTYPVSDRNSYGCESSPTLVPVDCASSSADLEISKSAAPSPVNSGEELIYTLTITNLGPGAASGVVIRDTVSAFPAPKYSLNPGGPWTEDWSNSYSIGTLSSSQTFIIYIRGIVPAGQCNPVTNRAWVSGSLYDPDPLNNTSGTISTPVTDVTGPVIGNCPQSRTITGGCAPEEITDPSYSTTQVVTSYAVFSSAPNNGSASDNCGITEVSYIDVASGTCPVTVNRTWTVKDAAGGTDVCVQQINLDVPPQPSFAAVSDIWIECSSAPPAPSSLSYTNGAAGNCLISGSVTSILSGSYGLCGGTYTESWSYTDVCNRLITASRIIHVNEAPQALFVDPPGNITIPCNEAPPSAVTLTVGNGGNGVCQISESSIGTVTGSHTGSGGSYTENWYYMDACNRAITHERTITVSPLASPGPITGEDEVCNGYSATYSVPDIPGATFNWSVPAGTVIESGQGTHEIVITWGETSGDVCVMYIDGTCNSDTACFAVEVKTVPGMPQLKH
jgi:uncharacterized repeat protein (TIGR01451 family)